jgi:hypothetical protein
MKKYQPVRKLLPIVNASAKISVVKYCASLGPTFLMSLHEFA